MTVRLNIGCGPRPANDWDNTDITTPAGPWPCFTHDIRGRFPREDAEQFDYAVAHHVLDMLDDVEVASALVNIAEVLKPDGVLRISTPDIVAGFRAWERGDSDWFPLQHASIDERFCTWLTWNGTRRSLWTFGRWSRGLYQAGFRDVRRCEFGLTKLCADPGICDLDSRAGESLFLEAIK